MLSLCGLVLLLQWVLQEIETAGVIDFYGAGTMVHPKSASPAPDLQGLPPAAELLFRLERRTHREHARRFNSWQKMLNAPVMDAWRFEMVVLPRRTYDLKQYLFVRCFCLKFRRAVWKDMLVGRGILFVLRRSYLTQLLRLYLQPSPTEVAVLHYLAELVVHGCLGTQIPSGLCRLG